MLTLLSSDSLPPQSNFLFCSLHMYNKTTRYFQKAVLFTIRSNTTKCIYNDSYNNSESDNNYTIKIILRTEKKNTTKKLISQVVLLLKMSRDSADTISEGKLFHSLLFLGKKEIYKYVHVYNLCTSTIELKQSKSTPIQ